MKYQYRQGDASGTGPSLLLGSAAARVAAALVLVGLLWLAAFWAMAA